MFKLIIFKTKIIKINNKRTFFNIKKKIKNKYNYIKLINLYLKIK